MPEEVNNQSTHFTTKGSLPAITLNMLLDFLRDHTVLSYPKSSRREFTSLVPVSSKDLPTFSPSEEDTHTLYVCHSDTAEMLLEKFPFIFLLALNKEDKKPAWAKRYPDRILLIHEKENFSYFNFLLQNYFVEIMVWERDLDQVVLRKGSMRELLEVGSSLMNNFMSINDSRFNLIAYTEKVDPPDAISKHLIKEGCLPEHIIEAWKEAILAKELMLEEPTEEIPYPQLHCPIYINHVYFASIVMICSKTPVTKGLEDLFLKLIKRATLLCDQFYKKQMQANFPHYFFFSKLIKGEEMTDDYVRVQTALTNIPQPGEFKLIALETGEVNRAHLVPRIMTAASQLNDGNCYSFPYKDKLYVLYYSEPSDNRLSHIKSFKQLTELVYEPFGIYCGVSQVFDNIRDLDMACKQTRIALRLKNTLRNELYVTGEQQEKGIFLFEETMLYYLISEQDRDERFINFTMNHTIVEKLYAEDQENGTNYVALFWFYLYHERNASMVAQRLHMHRNTVVYHIEKIQKRFDFDLATQSAQERMRIDFKSFFLQSSNETLEGIFSDQKDAAFSQFSDDE